MPDDANPTAPASGTAPPTPARGHGRRPGRPRAATAGVMLVLASAGLLFAVSAETARGTQLRSDRADAAGLVRSEQERHAARLARNADLRKKLTDRIEAEAAGNGTVRALGERAARLEPMTGLGPVAGPALSVTLDDAPRSGRTREGVKPDDLVVHQQDVQAVVNALWAGGAEAMMLMDQRVISTSAVRCVGNTLILQGRVYSPPYTVTAIGDPARMRAALAASPQLEVYQDYVRVLGLGYVVQEEGEVTLPAYSGSLEMSHAVVPSEQSAASVSPSGTRSSGRPTDEAAQGRPTRPATSGTTTP